MIENFGSSLWRLRQEKDVSQKELAQEIGITAQSLSNIEKGRNYPTFATLDKIATFFNATPTELLGSRRDIEVERTIYETDEYLDKAHFLLTTVREFRALSKALADATSPEHALSLVIKELVDEAQLNQKEGNT